MSKSELKDPIFTPVDYPDPKKFTSEGDPKTSTSEGDVQVKLFILIVFHLFGETLLKRHHEQLNITLPLPPTKQPLPPVALSTKPPPTRRPPPLLSLDAKYERPCPIMRVAIVGAGVAGLRAAMTLGSYGYNVDVYEAADDNRVGGRLYTGQFTAGGEFDYFDVGAMRFPDTPVMRSTFALFRQLGIPLGNYTIEDPETFLLFNNIRLRRGSIDWSTDPFQVGVTPHRGVIPDEYARQKPSELMRTELQLFIDKLIADPETGLQYLLRFDHYSTRSYLATRGFSPAVINYLETMTIGTGWFDRAFTETVLEELAFQYNGQPINWRYVVGGSSLIIARMKQELARYPNVTLFTQHRVTAVNYNPGANNLTPLTVRGEQHGSGVVQRFGPAPGGYTYSHVLFTIPPPCLLAIDLSTCQMDLLQRDAIRQVSIGPSCKIGVMFRSAWWSNGQHGFNINGGQSSTDRPVRTVVYPSYGGGESKTLIASYVWTQDSATLGAMMNNRNMLKRVVLADLAAVHNVPLQTLEDEFLAMYPFDWAAQVNSIGAFGVFGPSQFKEFYPALTRPCANGRVNFAGEAISTIHGWVAGSLESADRAVLQMMANGIADRDANKLEEFFAAFDARHHPDLGVNRANWIIFIIHIQVSIMIQTLEYGGPLDDIPEPELAEPW